MTKETDVLIAGAGISALATAWKLRRHGLRVLVACDKDHIGGVIESVREDGWLLEKGPNSYSSFGQEEEDFLSDIGVADRALRRPIKTTDRYIFHSGKLHKVPTGPGAFLTSGILPLSQRIRMLSGAFLQYKKPHEDIALGEFFRSAIGDAAVETLLKPAVAGIYAADADRISLDATFPKLARGIRNNRRLISAAKSMRSGPKDPNAKPKALTSFPEGLEELPRALHEKLRTDPGFELRTGAAPILQRGEDLPWRFLLDGETVEGHAVVLCAPAPKAAAMLQQIASEAAQIPASLAHAPLTVVHAGVKREDLPGEWNGFGFLTRRNEGVRMLGSIWSSAIFDGRAPEGHMLLTCFYGGEIDPEATDLSDGEQQAALVKDLETTMGYRGKAPELLRIRRWKPALPVFRPGHERLMKNLNDRLPDGVHVVSNWTGGVSIPDRVRGGWDVADRIAQIFSDKSAETAEK